jgi:hypothetical protein
LLIELDRFRICVAGFIRDQPDFCLTNDKLGRIYRAYGTHVRLPEFFRNPPLNLKDPPYARVNCSLRRNAQVPRW